MTLSPDGPGQIAAAYLENDVFSWLQITPNKLLIRARDAGRSRMGALLPKLQAALFTSPPGAVSSCPTPIHPASRQPGQLLPRSLCLRLLLPPASVLSLSVLCTP